MGNFREKNFKALWLFAKVFTVKLEGVVSFSGTSEQSVKVFSHENFPLYGMLHVKCLPVAEESGHAC